MNLHGRVQNGVVVFQGGDAGALPEGTLVKVTPLDEKAASGPAGLPATEPVSQERKEALLQLIGICKTDHPPSDEEVEQIIEQERMKKYG